MSKKNKLVKSWVNRHVNDHYVHMAQADGYRSRAAYKLAQIDAEVNLLHNVKTVVDLGCAPGSWSQYIVKKIGLGTTIIGVDLLPIEPIAKLHFIQGDFTEQQVLDEILLKLESHQLDLIVSDMAPNLSGIKNVDQVRSSYLVELVLDFALHHLKSGGDCLIKVFHGSEFDELVKLARTMFAQVSMRKPKSSRSSSAEAYLLCRNKKFEV